MTKVYKAVFLSVLKNFKEGLIKISFPDGSQLEHGDQKSTLVADMKIHSNDFFRKLVLSADIGLGEAYVNCDWSSSDLSNFFRWALLNVESSGMISGTKKRSLKINALRVFDRWRHLLNKNTVQGSQKNISAHYDLSNDFYNLMLDPTMMYSCAYFENANTDLESAQLNKLKFLCQDLDIRSTDHILEIGCGWGGFATYAARNYGCKVTGVTISKKQFEYCLQRAKSEQLDHLLSFQFCDYRNLDGKYDKIISIEMLEAVGHEYLPDFFKKCEEVLKPDGALVVQVITSPDSRYESFKNGVDWIQKYIFPGSLLPSVAALNEASSQQSKLHMYQLRDIGIHYGQTLRHWKKRFLSRIEDVKKLKFDDRFIRMWEYYLSYCESAFDMRNISDVQITYIRPNNTLFKKKPF